MSRQLELVGFVRKDGLPSESVPGLYREFVSRFARKSFSLSKCKWVGDEDVPQESAVYPKAKAGEAGFSLDDWVFVDNGNGKPGTVNGFSFRLHNSPLMREYLAGEARDKYCLVKSYYDNEIKSVYDPSAPYLGEEDKWFDIACFIADTVKPDFMVGDYGSGIEWQHPLQAVLKKDARGLSGHTGSLIFIGAGLVTPACLRELSALEAYKSKSFASGCLLQLRPVDYSRWGGPDTDAALKIREAPPERIISILVDGFK